MDIRHLTPNRPISTSQPPNVKVNNLKKEGNIVRLLEIASSSDHPFYTQSLNALVDIAFDATHFKVFEALEGLRKLSLIENSTLNEAEFQASMKDFIENINEIELNSPEVKHSHRVLFPPTPEKSKQTTTTSFAPPENRHA